MSRGPIVALLESDHVPPRIEPRARLDQVPLSFSQLAHWQTYRLYERPAVRQIAAALRLKGLLSIEALQESLTQLVYRHEALRTRIVSVNGAPVQQIDQPAPCKLPIEDLSTQPSSTHEPMITRRIEELILEPIDVDRGPLFGVQLLKLSEREQVLIVAMEHMISDAASMSIFLQELFTAYGQLRKSQAVSLPAIPIQFGDYAVWQRAALRSWMKTQGGSWIERLTNCQRARFPADQSANSPRSGWGTVPLCLGKDLKAQLREWCRLRQTTLAMSVFTAYIALMLRWCNASETVVLYQSDGRSLPEISQTIGYFASLLYLRISPADDERFTDLLHRVTREYCHAYEQGDFSYIESQTARPEFTANSGFNWVPHGSGAFQMNGGDADQAFTAVPIPFTHPVLRNLERDAEPVVLLFDTDEEIVGGVHFPLKRFSADLMERFGRNFTFFVETLLTRPDERMKHIPLCN
jgi:hypothetical protein